MKKATLALTLFLLNISIGFTQKSLVGINYEVNGPTNDGYLTKTSWRGGKLEFRQFIKKNLSLGLAMNWASYNQEFYRQTFESEDKNSAVTSDFVAHVYTLPFTATVHHYLKQKGNLRPYAGLALGAQYMDQRLYYNVYESDEFNWGFIASPEIGIIIARPEFNPGFQFGINYSFATNENGITKDNSFQKFGITIGVLIAQ